MQAYHRQNIVTVRHTLSWLQAPLSSQHRSALCPALLLGACHASSQAASSRGTLSCSTLGRTLGRSRGTLWAFSPSSSSGMISQGMSGGEGTTLTLGSGSRRGMAQGMGTLTLLETACTATPARQVRAGWLPCSAGPDGCHQSLPAAAGFAAVRLVSWEHRPACGHSADGPGQDKCSCLHHFAQL